jgi:hypothetical protein
MTTLSPLSSRNMTPPRASPRDEEDDVSTIPALCKPKPDMDDATPPPVNPRFNTTTTQEEETSTHFAQEEEATLDVPFDENDSPIRSNDSPTMEQETTRPTAAASIPPQQQQPHVVDPDEAESIALARMLMEQEAVESYGQLSADYLRYNSHLYSPDDLAALQAAMAQDDDDDDSNHALSYDTMLRLGESIGNVKKERWTLTAQEQIDKLPLFLFDSTSVVGKDEHDTDVKCLVCQFPYKDQEELRRLPCGHAFHSECVETWLKDNDICPYCRQTIVKDEGEDDVGYKV